MFAPSREQVRQFFSDAWAKYRAGTPLQGLETIALDVILLHPEYRVVLEAPERAAEHDYTPEMGETNPFLHMSLHLAIEEQLSIDQPPGIRAAFDEVLRKADSRHDALHTALECLGEMMWKSQRDGTAPDGQAYLECLRGRHRP
ncbi:MAG: hypothetical protein A3G25_14225 [Betaproteobacteria bacterium RIFCSPLOWO2_12_FULL_63_13]|nr:MAG: hypothetical protein A3H32_02270 [Betaproteobacteria bacterium RIFCSPLOWO2_02_FULL_63_19]OGA50774.1 MAG: hypothetical protein A3G25_14225 [Betaproteobacteria bacterium RIFCSPLOWO2_12_FULL_63_13]